jgi:hypothetical protein
MVFDGKIAILREVFPDFRIRKGCEFVTFCPTRRCKSTYGNDKRKLEINLHDNKFACWRCHYSGSPLKLLKEYGKGNQRKRYAELMGLHVSEDTEKERVQLPEEYKFILDHPGSPAANRALEWISDLGLTENIVYQNRVGVCDSGDYRNRLVFPSFDSDGRLNYFVTRHLYDNNDFKWLNCRASMKDNVFNELFIEWNEPIVLVESVKAYLKHFDSIDNLVCCNGTRISRKHKLFEKIVLNDVPVVFVAFDAVADEEAMDAMKEFYEYGIDTRFVKFPGEAQPDHISGDEFSECLANAQEFDYVDGIKMRIKRYL